MEQERGNFRGRVFGFDRQDVIDYIEELAAQRNMLQRENQELRERLWDFENGVEDAPEIPGAPETEADNEADGAETDDTSADTALDDARAEMESAIAEARELLRTVRCEYDSLCADVKINASHAEGELRTVAERLAAIRGTLNSAGERLDAIGERLEGTEE